MDVLTPAMMAQLLQEPEQGLLGAVLQAIGQERCTAVLVDALTLESNGGMLIKSGARRRTPGGVFFFLVRQQCTKEERAQLFPYRVLARPSPGIRQETQTTPRPAKKPPGTLQIAIPTQAPVTLTLADWKGLTPMPVTATLKLVLRELPETRESGGMVYMALTNEPKGLPKGITLESGPLYLTAPVKQWKTACTRAAEIRATGLPALLIVECHVSTREGALIGVVKTVQVVEGKAAVAPSA